MVDGKASVYHGLHPTAMARMVYEIPHADPGLNLLDILTDDNVLFRLHYVRVYSESS
jgi:hypothetical protein